MSEQLFKFAEKRYSTVLEDFYIQEAMCVYLPKFQQLKVKSTDRLLHEIDRDVFSKVSLYASSVSTVVYSQGVGQFFDLF